MSNKNVSDYRGRPRPRSGYNCDVVRNLVECGSVDALKSVADALCAKHNGYIKYKNLFAVPDAELQTRFNLACVMLSVLHTSELTYGAMCSDETVRAKWAAHRANLSEFVPRHRWELCVDAAIAILNSASLGGQRVSLIVESQLQLRPYAEARRCMHELYKAWRPVTARELWVDFMVSADKKDDREDLSQAESMYEACSRGQLPVVQQMIQDKADVNSTNYEGAISALWVASWKGHYDVVQCLLEHNVDPNIQRPDNQGTPLIVASQDGHTDVVHLLIESKASAARAALCHAVIMI